MTSLADLRLILVHCEGEIGRVVLDGVPNLPGRTMAEKLQRLNSDGDWLRRYLVLEPRGAAAGSVNLLLPACRSDADIGFLVLQPDQAHAMSGSNAMCAVTALLECGRVKLTEPETIICLDTAAGLVTATAKCRNGKCERVYLDMVPAFVEELDQEIETETWGTIRADICFGGVFYALIDITQLGLKIEPAQVRDLVSAGMAIKSILNSQHPVRHPEVPTIRGIAYVMFRDIDPDGVTRTCTTLWPGRVDRSPCGTGSSALLATLYKRGEATVGDRLVTRSIIGSEFHVEFKGTTRVANRDAILPRISGRCWIYGSQQLTLNEDDPFSSGFAISDTWGPEAWRIG